MKLEAKKDLILIALESKLYNEAAMKLWQNDGGTQYNHSVGYLRGILTSFELDLEQKDEKIIITHQKSGRLFMKFNKEEL